MDGRPFLLEKVHGFLQWKGEALQDSGEGRSVDKQLQAGEPPGGRSEGSLDARAGTRLLVCAETVEMGTELEGLLRLEGRLGNQLNAGSKEEGRARDASPVSAGVDVRRSFPGPRRGRGMLKSFFLWYHMVHFTK